MPASCHKIIKKMLCPDVNQRATIEEVLQDPFVAGIEVCVDGRAKNGHTHGGVPFAIVRET